MEAFSALLTLCAGNSPVTCEFLAQRPVTRSFGVFFDLRLNKRLSKESWGWWFETPSYSLWRHCNVMHMLLNCVAVSISIYTRLERSETILTDQQHQRWLMPPIISKRRKFEHIIPVLKELHWLPVEHRISYEILLLTYKALNGYAPQYLLALKICTTSASVSMIIISSIHQDVGLNRLQRELSPKQPQPSGTLWNPLPLSVKQAPHDGVIKWKHFPHKGQWHGALMFSLICAWINGWANNREAGDLRRHRVNYDVIVMEYRQICLPQ